MIFFDDLCQTRSMVRLKDIGMDCGMNYTSYPLFIHIPPYNRYDHSVNVSKLIYRFSNDEKASIAGLFHDISTPVFSHVVDFMQKDYLQQESTEEGTSRILQQDEAIVSLLKQHGISLDEVNNYHRYPIADNDSPKLSCDRLEYTLTNGIRFGYLTRFQKDEILNHIEIGKNETGEEELVFNTSFEAKLLCKVSLLCGKVYAGNDDRFAMEFLSRLLNQAIQQAILNQEDLMSEEHNVILKLSQSPLQSKWLTFTRLSYTKTQKEQPKEEGWLRVPAKKRYIDPYVKGKGRVSLIDEEIEKEIDCYKKEDQQVYLKGV